MPMQRFDHLLEERPFVTYVLMATMVIASLPLLLVPSLSGLWDGLGPPVFAWQHFTPVFVHGWPNGLPLLVHLLANLLLLSLVGPTAEKLLGQARFLLLAWLAILLFALARQVTGIEANGASAFIWAYSPLIWWALRDKEFGDEKWRSNGRAALWVMWMAIPLAMGFLLAFDAPGNPLAGLLWGNIYHLTGVVAGFAGLLLWRRLLDRRLAGESPHPSAADKAAAALSLLMPAFFVLLLALTAVGALATT